MLNSRDWHTIFTVDSSKGAVLPRNRDRYAYLSTRLALWNFRDALISRMKYRPCRA